jgi:hypothetical protein
MTNHQYGPKGHIVDAFLEHLKEMTEADWLAVSAVWYAVRDEVLDAVWDAVRDAAGYAASDAASDAARDAARDATVKAAINAVRDAVGCAAGSSTGYAVWEILGADLLRERGQPFVFLPMFGFADEQAIIKQENAV